MSLRRENYKTVKALCRNHLLFAMPTGTVIRDTNRPDCIEIGFIYNQTRIAHFEIGTAIVRYFIIGNPVVSWGIYTHWAEEECVRRTAGHPILAILNRALSCDAAINRLRVALPQSFRRSDNIVQLDTISNALIRDASV